MRFPELFIWEFAAVYTQMCWRNFVPKSRENARRFLHLSKRYFDEDARSSYPCKRPCQNLLVESSFCLSLCKFTRISTKILNGCIFEWKIRSHTATPWQAFWSGKRSVFRRVSLIFGHLWLFYLGEKGETFREEKVQLQRNSIEKVQTESKLHFFKSKECNLNRKLKSNLVP